VTRIVVMGGSGLVGARLVSLLTHQAHDVLAASRATGVNALTGAGLDEALDGAEVVIDVMDASSIEGQGPLDFFGAASLTLAAAEQDARIRHHIALSIVGADRLDSSYFRAKVLQENIVRASPIPYTILRSTQFFELVERIVRTSTERDVIRLPPALAQPLASEDVATELARIASNPPANATLELAGPEQISLEELARLIMSMHEDMRQVLADPSAPYFGATLSPNALLPGPGARIAPATFGNWLRQQISPD
jgi:uncharacterized protein YbjT (DUF2867 family)